MLVRYLTRDDADQYVRAVTLVAQNRILIVTTVILETEWVLRYKFRFDRQKILSAFLLLLRLPNVEFSDRETVMEAIRLCADGMDFADALHLSSGNAAALFATFDRDLIKSAESNRVVEP